MSFIYFLLYYFAAFAFITFEIFFSSFFSYLNYLVGFSLANHIIALITTLFFLFFFYFLFLLSCKILIMAQMLFCLSISFAAKFFNIIYFFLAFFRQSTCSYFFIYEKKSFIEIKKYSYINSSPYSKAIIYMFFLIWFNVVSHNRVDITITFFIIKKLICSS